MPEIRAGNPAKVRLDPRDKWGADTGRVGQGTGGHGYLSEVIDHGSEHRVD